MIHGFERAHPTESETTGRFQWSSALGAGLIAGVVLLIVPRGSPWSSLTFFAPVIAGRVVPAEMGMPLGAVMAVHLAISLGYGLIISRAVTGVRQLRSLLVGGLIGLVLYFVNLGIVAAWIPLLAGNEVSVVFTHIVFGLIAGGAYRGLLRRRLVAGSTSDSEGVAP